MLKNLIIKFFLEIQKDKKKLTRKNKLILNLNQFIDFIL